MKSRILLIKMWLQETKEVNINEEIFLNIKN